MKMSFKDTSSILEELSKLEIVVKFKVSSIVMNNVELDIFKKELLGKDKIHKKIIERDVETRGRKNKYSEKDIDYILNSGQGNVYLAKRYDTTMSRIIKLKSYHRRKRNIIVKKKQYESHFKKNELTPTDIPAVKAE